MPVAVVVQLEGIHVQNHQGQGPLVPDAALPFVGEPLGEAAAVGNAGEAVLQGHLLQQEPLGVQLAVALRQLPGPLRHLFLQRAVRFLQGLLLQLDLPEVSVNFIQHLIEGVGQIPHLVPAFHRSPDAVVPPGDFLGRLPQGLDGPGQPPHQPGDGDAQQHQHQQAHHQGGNRQMAEALVDGGRVVGDLDDAVRIGQGAFPLRVQLQKEVLPEGPVRPLHLEGPFLLGPGHQGPALRRGFEVLSAVDDLIPVGIENAHALHQRADADQILGKAPGLQLVDQLIESAYAVADLQQHLFVRHRRIGKFTQPARGDVGAQLLKPDLIPCPYLVDFVAQGHIERRKRKILGQRLC